MTKTIIIMMMLTMLTMLMITPQNQNIIFKVIKYTQCPKSQPKYSPGHDIYEKQGVTFEGRRVTCDV